MKKNIAVRFDTKGREVGAVARGDQSPRPVLRNSRSVSKRDRMVLLTIVIMVCTLIFGSSDLHARRGGQLTSLLGREVTLYRTSSNGKVARFTMRASSDPIYAAEILTRPKHGTATVRGLQVRYKPAPGYKGDDDFNYQLVGKRGGTVPDAAKIHAMVTVK